MSGELLATLVLGLLAAGFAGAELMNPPRWLRWVLGALSVGCFVSALLLLVSFAPFAIRSPIVFGIQSPIVFPPPPQVPPKNVPMMKVESETLQLKFGSISSSGPTVEAEGQAAPFPCFGTDPWISPSGRRMKAMGCFVESCSVHIFVENGYLYLNTAIYGELGQHCIRINHNRVIAEDLMLPNWDFNSNSRALEIINDAGFPMFQMILEPPNRLTVLGVFPFPNNEVLVTDTSSRTMMGGTFYDALVSPPSPGTPAGATEWRSFHLKDERLFKYPSWRHPGELE